MTFGVTEPAREMFDRSVLERLIERRLNDHDCVVLVGPRQVGKSTLAMSVASAFKGVVSLDLDKPEDARRVVDIDQLFSDCTNKLLVVDEAQLAPDLFPALRVEIDRQRAAGGRCSGKFLISGSASQQIEDLARKLTGRYSQIELLGFHILELPMLPRSDDPLAVISDDVPGVSSVDDFEAQKKLWLRGGMPSSYFASSDQVSFEWLNDYIRAYVDRELSGLTSSISSLEFEQVWQFIASQSSREWDWQKIPGKLSMKKDVVTRCVSLLKALRFVRELQPWSKSPGNRVAHHSKYYLRDTGLLHMLLNCRTFEQLEQTGCRGGSWETFAVEALCRSSAAAQGLFFYRDNRHNELDLVVEFDTTDRWGIEIKSGDNPRIEAGNQRAADELSVTRRLAVNLTGSTLSEAKGFEVMSLEAACNALRSHRIA